MDTQQKDLVIATWEQVKPIADEAATIFYDRLFERDSRLRALFPPDLTEQRQKLMTTLGLAIASMDRLDELRPTLQALGRKHVEYGVQPIDYVTAGNALLWTLEQGLKDAFTPEVREAWAVLWETLAREMLHGAEDKTSIFDQLKSWFKPAA